MDLVPRIAYEKTGVDKMVRWLIFLSTVCLVVISITLSSQAYDRNELVSELMFLSGLEKQISNVLPSMLASIEAGQRVSPIPERDHDLLIRVIRNFYNGESLKQGIRMRIDRSLDREHTLKVLNWLRSDLGRRITKLEEDASTPESEGKLQSYAAELRDKPPSPERIELIQRLDSAAKISELSAEVTVLTGFAISFGFKSVVPRDEQLDADQLLKRMKSRRDQLIPLFRKLNMVKSLYIYQTLADSELESYVGFADSESGGWYHRVLSEAYKEALVEAAMKTGKAFAEGAREPGEI
jgi:hypothetical protein